MVLPSLRYERTDDSQWAQNTLPQIKSASALVSRIDLVLNINRLRDADTVLRMFWSQVKQVDLKSLFRSFKVSYSVCHFQFQEGRVPMNKLLVEMLEANSQ